MQVASPRPLSLLRQPYPSRPLTRALVLDVSLAIVDHLDAPGLARLAKVSMEGLQYARGAIAQRLRHTLRPYVRHIDEFFQEKRPVAHHIVEARTGALNRLRRNGWLGKVGLIVHEGRWQDIVPKMIAMAQRFDAIYFDTFPDAVGLDPVGECAANISAVEGMARVLDRLRGNAELDAAISRADAVASQRIVQAAIYGAP